MSDPKRSTGQRKSKSLKQSLKDLLGLTKRAGPKANNVVGSGILRKADPSRQYLPTLSSLSLLPNFNTSQYEYGVDRSFASYPPPAPSPPAKQYVISNSVADSPSGSGCSLLPKTSLSQFDLNRTFVRQAPTPQLATFETVSDIYLSGASHQASYTTIAPSYKQRNASTLRLQRSSLSLAASRSVLSVNETPGLRSKFIEDFAQSSLQVETLIQGRTQLSTSKKRTPLALVDHFKSFCVLDAGVAGCPVTATSLELRYIFNKGEQFFLNNQECEGLSMDIISGSDAIGNPITHLLLFSPLIAPSSGRSRFMFVAMIDVTQFIFDTAYDATMTPDLDTISEEASLTEEIMTPSLSQQNLHWPSNGYELSADDLLGGCSMSELHNPIKRGERDDEDIWLALAATEGKLTRKTSRSSRTRRTSQHASAQTMSPRTLSSVSSVDDVLEDFMSNLQILYSNFFLLGKSPLDEDHYEIVNVSPKLYESKEYLEGHLSRTPPEDIQSLTIQLGEEEAFNMQIRWGSNGEVKRLYCSPLYNGLHLTWICFLVDNHFPPFWD